MGLLAFFVASCGFFGPQKTRADASAPQLLVSAFPEEPPPQHIKDEEPPPQHIKDDEQLPPVSQNEPRSEEPEDVQPEVVNTEDAQRVEYDIPHLKNPGSLSTFLSALESLGSRGEGLVRVAHFGDSHTAADFMTTEIRRALQGRFGDGGRGFVFLGRPWKYYRPKDIRLEESGRWRPQRFIISIPSDQLDGQYGFGGVAVECRVGRCDVAVRPSKSAYGKDIDFFELYYLRQPGGGSFVVKVDAKTVESVETDAEVLGSGFYALELEDAKEHRIEVRTLGDGPVRLFGAIVESRGPGVVYDTLGINGAAFETVLQWDRDIFLEQLERRGPDLIVAMYGTNESCSKTLTPAAYAAHVREVVQLFRQGAPGAACLLIGPPDRQGEPGELERLEWIISVQSEVAAELGCAFLDARQVMGGAGSHALWQVRGLAAQDGIHLTLRGYKELGEQIAGIFLQVYEAHAQPLEQKPKQETNRPESLGEIEPATPKKTKKAGDDDGST